MIFSNPHNSIVLVLLATVLLSGCGLNVADTPPGEFSQMIDIDGDGLEETIRFESTSVQLADEFTDVYPHVFYSAVVATSSGRELLRITPDGIIVENGDSIGAGITTHVAYAANIGSSPNQPVLQIVQLDESGMPVSEPLALKWNSSAQGWEVQ